MLEKCYLSMVMGNKGISQKVISKMAKTCNETFLNYFRDLLRKKYPVFKAYAKRVIRGHLNHCLAVMCSTYIIEREHNPFCEISAIGTNYATNLYLELRIFGRGKFVRRKREFCPLP